jgi:hypothetical protein
MVVAVRWRPARQVEAGATQSACARKKEKTTKAMKATVCGGRNVEATTPSPHSLQNLPKLRRGRMAKTAELACGCVAAATGWLEVVPAEPAVHRPPLVAQLSLRLLVGLALALAPRRLRSQLAALSATPQRHGLH